METLVTAFLGMIVVSLTLASATANRNVLARDTVRTRLNQDLRGALDIIGFDVRIAGENLPSSFPAVQLTDGGANPDVFIARRNLLDEILPLCTQINAGTNTTNIYFAIPGTISGCVYSGHLHDFTSWKSYRTTNNNQVQAFIYNSLTHSGEFFTYVNEGDNGTSYWLTRTAGVWANTYPTASSSIFVLEEWQYQIQNEMLQLVVNRDIANPMNVSFGITAFDVQAVMQDGTTKTAFLPTDSWTTISRLQFSVTGKDSFRGNPVNRTVIGSFFPRNVLSN